QIPFSQARPRSTMWPPSYSKASDASRRSRGRGSLGIFTRFERAKREDEYRSVYRLLCLDAHNNFSALSERHFGELPDGHPTLSFFKPPEVATLRSRLDAVIGMALGSAVSIYAAFRTSSGAFEPLA